LAVRNRRGKGRLINVLAVTEDFRHDSVSLAVATGSFSPAELFQTPAPDANSKIPAPCGRTGDAAAAGPLCLWSTRPRCIDALLRSAARGRRRGRRVARSMRAIA
jgi:hypothetical protein